MTDEDKALQELEAEKQKQAVEEAATAQAEKIAADKVEALKSSLIDSLGGKKADAAPKSWDELARKDDLDKKVTETIAPLQKEIEDLKKEREQLKSQREKTDNEIRLEKSRIDREWKELVEDGELPPIKPEIMAKIEKNESLTDDDRKDEGLTAYNELIKTHFETNKGGSLYRTLKHSLNRQPSGARAPVLGGRMRPTQVEGDDEDFTYDEIHKAAMNM
jgi:hypothetical protein